MSTMPTTPTDPREATTARLRALSLDNYRRTRWVAIDAARDLGMTWQEIGEALDGMDKSAARRLWINDNPNTPDTDAE